MADTIILDTPSPYRYILSKSLGDTGIFTIFEEISFDSMAVYTAFLLNAINTGLKEITVWINSGGGDPDAGRGAIAVMECAKNSGIVIKTIGIGLVASAAFDIFIAGSKGYRTCYNTTLFMTHSSSADVRDKDLVELIDDLDKWSLDTYTNIDTRTRNQFLRTGNWWLSAVKAKELGITDEVITISKGV